MTFIISRTLSILYNMFRNENFQIKILQVLGFRWQLVKNGCNLQINIATLRHKDSQYCNVTRKRTSSLTAQPVGRQ